MRRIRSGLTYTNVVATIALFLALSGSAVYAADKITSKQIGKGAVKSKNLAKNAVKAKNLAKNAVSSPKLAKGAVTNADIADGAVNFAKLAAGTDVVASATGGPVSVNQDFATIPLTPPVTVTPVAGQPLTVSLEARGTLMPAATSTCQVFLLPEVNGSPMLVGELTGLSSPDNPPEQDFPNGVPVSGITFPVGVGQPGVPQSIGLQMIGVDPTECAAGSRIDQVAVAVTQAK